MSMSYATLMVNLDVGRPNKACLHIAGELAARFEARLIGVAGADLQPQLYFAEGAAAAELIEKERGWLTSQIANCEKEFRNEPKRCRTCKNKRQTSSADRGSHGGRIETSTTCFQCGRETTVPFKPTQGRPVLCRDCFQDRKPAQV